MYCTDFCAAINALTNSCERCGEKRQSVLKLATKKLGLHILHSAREVVAVIGGRVEVVKRLGHQQISVGIKAADKLVALIAKIRFHFKLNAVTILNNRLILNRGRIFYPSRLRQDK